MLKTPTRIQQEKRDQTIYKAYCRLIARGAMKTAAEQAIMVKFNIGKRSTVWRINKRAASRITNAQSV